MGSRWYILMVTTLWLASMAWLLLTKVVPPLRTGEPPEFEATLPREAQDETVAWRLFWNDQRVGTAIHHQETAEGATKLHSRVQLADFPYQKLLPAWIRQRTLVDEMGNTLDLELENEATLQPDGELLGFQSAVNLPGMRDLIKLRGEKSGRSLAVTAQSGDFEYRTQFFLPSKTLVANDFSPWTTIRGLHEGQRWTMPVYSPLRPPHSPLEMIEAVVARQEMVVWEGRAVSTWVVIYRNDSGRSLQIADTPRAKLWVKLDGTVIKSEMDLLGSRLVFLRVDDSQAQEVARSLDWAKPFEQTSSPAEPIAP